MAAKKEVYKVYFALAVLILLILIAWKTHQRSKVPPGVFKDTAIVDLHYKVFSPAPEILKTLNLRKNPGKLSKIGGGLW